MTGPIRIQGTFTSFRSSLTEDTHTIADSGRSNATSPADLNLHGLQRKIAENVLKKLQEAPDAWTRVDGILEQSKSQHSKFFALQVSLQ